MFPWAGEGDLKHFMRRRDDVKANRDPTFVLEILSQLIGLAGAIEKIHKQKYRHGDLKPQNILIFPGKSRVGTWKVADLGLAKFHYETTGHRIGPTTMIGSGTISYEPPETFTAFDSPRSRLYDIWSMGCIMLELVLCLLYGRKAYATLMEKTRNPAAQGHSAAWEAKWNGRQWTDTKIHGEVWNAISKLEREFGSGKSSSVGAYALVELAGLVKRRLLVVQLPPERGSCKQSARRARADEVHLELKQIKKQLSDKLGSHPPPAVRQENLQVQPLSKKPEDTAMSGGRPNLESRSSRGHSSNRIPGSHVSQQAPQKTKKRKKLP